MKASCFVLADVPTPIGKLRVTIIGRGRVEVFGKVRLDRKQIAVSFNVTWTNRGWEVAHLERPSFNRRGYEISKRLRDRILRTVLPSVVGWIHTVPDRQFAWAQRTSFKLVRRSLLNHDLPNLLESLEQEMTALGRIIRDRSLGPAEGFYAKISGFF